MAGVAFSATAASANNFLSVGQTKRDTRRNQSSGLLSPVYLGKGHSLFKLNWLRNCRVVHLSIWADQFSPTSGNFNRPVVGISGTHDNRVIFVLDKQEDLECVQGVAAATVFLSLGGGHHTNALRRRHYTPSQTAMCNMLKRLLLLTFTSRRGRFSLSPEDKCGCNEMSILDALLNSKLSDCDKPADFLRFWATWFTSSAMRQDATGIWNALSASSETVQHDG